MARLRVTLRRSERLRPAAVRRVEIEDFDDFRCPRASAGDIVVERVLAGMHFAGGEFAFAGDGDGASPLGCR